MSHQQQLKERINLGLRSAFIAAKEAANEIDGDTTAFLYDALFELLSREIPSFSVDAQQGPVLGALERHATAAVGNIDVVEKVTAVETVERLSFRFTKNLYGKFT
jgi:hypothetical protein